MQHVTAVTVEVELAPGDPVEVPLKVGTDVGADIYLYIYILIGISDVHPHWTSRSLYGIIYGMYMYIYIYIYI